LDYIIFYFSGTGNTQLIAEEIKIRLESKGSLVQMISIEDKEALEKADLTGKTIGFGYPVYKFSYPDILNSVIEKINSIAEGNDFFQFCTYARFTGDAFADFLSALNKDKFRLTAQKSFKSPSCGISSCRPYDDYEYLSVMFFEDDIDKRLDEFTEEISEAKLCTEYSKRNKIHSFRKRIVEDIEITKYPKLTINADLCTNCGLCADNCPENNLTKGKEGIKITDDKGCLHCLRCINHCPKNAVSFGRLSQGDNRYTIKIRDMLFKKSTDGYKEEYWQNFDRVAAKWRANTIKYWLAHRGKPEY